MSDPKKKNPLLDPETLNTVRDKLDPIVDPSGVDPNHATMASLSAIFIAAGMDQFARQTCVPGGKVAPEHALGPALVACHWLQEAEDAGQLAPGCGWADVARKCMEAAIALSSAARSIEKGRSGEEVTPVKPVDPNLS